VAACTAAIAAQLALAAPGPEPAAAAPPGGLPPGLQKLIDDKLGGVRESLPPPLREIVDGSGLPNLGQPSVPTQSRAPQNVPPHAAPAQSAAPPAGSSSGGAPAVRSQGPPTRPAGGGAAAGRPSEPTAIAQQPQELAAPGATAEIRPARRRARRAPVARAGGAGSATAPAASGAAAAATDGAPATGRDDGGGRSAAPVEAEGIPVVRTVRDIVEVFPAWAKLLLGALAALCLALAGAYLLSTLRARSLARQRGELLRDVGLLQSALLPQVPEKLGALTISVAYRPAEGPAAGGDFYDALALADGRVGFVLGDVSGHGRDALERTAFVRHSLRAYLKAGLEPRVALQVAGRVIGDGLGDDFVTVLVAIHDPASGTLTYASAGHPAPIVSGDRGFDPVLAGGSPPIGFGLLVGQRQTTVPLPPGAVACLYTDGLVEARTADGLVGRDGLERMVAELGPGARAEQVVAGVGAAARGATDDMAVCLLTPTSHVAIGGFRTEQLDLSARELEGPLLERFLTQCGVGADESYVAQHEARNLGPRFGGVNVTAVLGSRRTVEILPRNVESLEAAARRASAEAA
jgi:hypothetical protein